MPSAAEIMSGRPMGHGIRRALQGVQRFDIAIDIATSLLHRLPPNMAHWAVLGALRLGLMPPSSEPDDPVLASLVWGIEFANPIGLAAGFDKDAEAVDALLGLDFGFVEFGTVTPLPQPGNPRPNLFRLDADKALINRLGFNSRGLDFFAARLERHRRSGTTLAGVIGANLGRNRDSRDGAADYAQVVRATAGLADYLVINISSPNTPGLRGLQQRDRLTDLLGGVLSARDAASAGRKVPLLVKIAPDLTEDEIGDIARVADDQGVDGLIVSNTTVARPVELRDPDRTEEGGLSGPPLFPLSAAVLGRVRRATGGRIPLIGCGGVATGADAYAMIRAGASLVQIYTAFVYQGPSLVGRIKRDLASRLKADGFSSLKQAVGADLPC